MEPAPPQLAMIFSFACLSPGDIEGCCTTPVTCFPNAGLNNSADLPVFGQLKVQKCVMSAECWWKQTNCHANTKISDEWRQGQWSMQQDEF
jgi:hypothetical protein